MNLPLTISISATHIICQEGCVITSIQLFDETKLRISSRIIDLSDINIKQNFENVLKKLAKTFICLFNEYRIVLENVLHENMIAFSVCKN